MKDKIAFVRKLVFKAFRQVYWPLCRVYAKRLGDKPADRTLRIMCIWQFFATNDYWPNFDTPRTFAEKLWGRMFCDRNHQLTMLSDKILAREFVTQKVGSKYLIPILWQGENAEGIPFEKLPEKFVIKANHGCGYNIIVNDKKRFDSMQAIHRIEKWLNENYCQDHFMGTEWSYKNIEPQCFIETYIGNESKVAVDYKFWCFNGRVELVTVHFDRFEKHRVATLNRNFDRYQFRFPLDDGTVEPMKPANWDEMIGIAESLAEGIDFIRVDLYNHRGALFFGEFTVHPGGVCIEFKPRTLDDALGEKWV